MGRRSKFDGQELKKLRKCTPYTQEELAHKVGISRETVNAIENNRIETMSVINVEVILKWKSICETYLDASRKSAFKEYIMKYFGI